MTGLETLKSNISLLRPFLKKGSIDKPTSDFLRNQMDKIIPFLFVPVIDYKIDTICRITINERIKDIGNNRIFSLKYLKYPDKSIVKKFGRANYDFQSRLYGTFDIGTALKEMKPEVGNLITESVWKLKDDCVLKIAPIFMITSGNDNETHNEMSLYFKLEAEKIISKFSENESSQFIELSYFISECFAKNVDNDNCYDYFLSSFFSNKIFNEINNGEVEAIIYPSVQSSLEFSNIVIKPEIFDSKFELLDINERVLISKNPIYLKGIGYLDVINSDNEIKWT